MKKAAALIEEEECDIETSEKINSTKNKTITVIKRVEHCKPFVASSILFVRVPVIITGIMIYFCLKSKNDNVLPY